MNDQLKQDILAAQNHDTDALERCIQQNMGLVYSIVHRYHVKTEENDLIQIGCIGLIKAIQNFDFSYNVMFSTYAVPIILGEIKRYFRDDNTIRISRRVKENGIKIHNATDSLWQIYGRQPTIKEIAQYLDMDEDDVLHALEASQTIIRMDEKIIGQDDNDLEWKDVFGTEESDIVLSVSLKEEILKLDDKEQLLLNLRYHSGFNQQTVADRLNMSQVQVSRLEKKILNKLKERLNI